MNKPTFIIKYLNRTTTEDRTSQNAWPNFSLIRLLAFRGILESNEEQNDVTYYTYIRFLILLTRCQVVYGYYKTAMSWKPHVVMCVGKLWGRPIILAPLKFEFK